MVRAHWPQGHCYACGFRWGSSGSRISRPMAAQLYEIAVETVEAQRGGFTLTSIWRQARARADHELTPEDRTGYRWGPSMSSYAAHAVYDMAAHGLVRCVDFRRAAREGGRDQCRLWELTSLSSVA